MTAHRPLHGGAIAAAGALALYVATMGSDVGPIDSGELTLAAWELGVPHPPGFPLYVVVAHLFAQIPIGSIAMRVNLSSALFAALAVGGVFGLTLRVLSPGEGHSQDESIPKARESTLDRARADIRPYTTAPMLCGAMTAALLFGSLRTPWAYATVAEVYSLAICLALLIWQLMLRPSFGRMRWAAGLFGLAMGAHPAIMLPMLPAFALIVSRAYGVGFFRTRRFAELFVLAALGAGLVYLYLPLAAARSPVLNWGDPRSWERFWEHISGWQYRGEAVDLTGRALAAAVRRMGLILWHQGGGPGPPLALLFAGVGVVHAVRTRRRAFAPLALWVVANVLLVAPMNARWAGDRPTGSTPVDDLDAYYLPMLVVVSILAGTGVTAVLASRRQGAGRAVRLGLAGVVAAITILQPLSSNWRVNDRRRDLVTRNYAEDVLRSIETGGLLFMRDWSLSSPLMYVQHAERQRLDVIGVDLNLMERHWYMSSLLQRHPAAFAPALAEFSAYLRLVRRWQDDPSSIQRDPGYHSALVDAFDTLLIRLAEHYARKAPVFVTYEVATAQDGKGQSLAAKLGARFQLVPHGLVFRLEADRHFHESTAVALRVTPLLDVVRGAGNDHPNAQWIADVYRNMFISRGLYLEQHDRCGQAVDAFRQALAIDPPPAAAAAIGARCGGRISAFLKRPTSRQPHPGQL